MLSKATIQNILQNKKYYANGFYKNKFREFEGNIELDDGQVISFEIVEERIREEMNYFDSIYHLLEIDKQENEDYYCNMVFFNKCDSEGYWNGFDINGNNRKGFNKYKYEYEYEYKESNGYIFLENGEKISFEDVEKRLQDPDGYYWDPLHHLEEEKLNYLKNIRFYKKCDKEGFDKHGRDVNGFDKSGFDKDGYNRDGYDLNGINFEGYNVEGYDRDDFDIEGYDCDGYDIEGYNEDGYDCNGYDIRGYDIRGYDIRGIRGINGYEREGNEGDSDDDDGEEEDNLTGLTSPAA